jgi:5-methylcytosine-specific restriction endonuclease McrBC regulatory subunit McrC
MKRLIRCEEWSKLRIGRGMELETLADVSAIIAAWKGSTGVDPAIHFEIRADALIPRFWSGTLDTPDLTLEVSPIGSLALDSKMRARLDSSVSEMLAIASSSQSVSAGFTSLSGDGSRQDSLLSAFCSDLRVARRRQIIRRYASFRESTASPKGKIAFPAQCYESLRRPGRFSSEWVALTEDVAENRVFKEVLLRFQARCSASVRGTIDSCLADLDAVGRPADWRLEWTRIRGDRLTAGYRLLLERAKALLEEGGVGIFSGDIVATAEIVFTSRLFEKFISSVVASVVPALALGSTAQKRGVYLCSRNTNQNVFELIPDILITDSQGATRAILDAKWKYLSQDKKNLGIAREDVYQLLAYVAKYNCRNAFLVYPDVTVATGAVGFYEKFTSHLLGATCAIHVVKLPLLARDLRAAANFLFEVITVGLGIERTFNVGVTGAAG